MPRHRHVEQEVGRLRAESRREHEEKRRLEKQYDDEGGFLEPLGDDFKMFIGRVKFGPIVLPPVYGSIASTTMGCIDPYSDDILDRRECLIFCATGGQPDPVHSEGKETNDIKLRIWANITSGGELDFYQVESVLSNSSKSYFEGVYQSRAALMDKLVPPYFF